MYTQEFLEKLKQQEQDLRFASFDLEDAYTLGTMLREAGKKEPEPIAVRVVLDDLAVYQSFLPGTGLSNSQWMDRKYATAATPPCWPPWSGSWTASRSPGSLTRSSSPSAAAASPWWWTANSGALSLSPACPIWMTTGA